MNHLPESRIERELNKLIPVTVPYNLRRHFPFRKLGRQRLELLLFALFRRGLESGAYKKEFDDLALSSSIEGLGRIVLFQHRKQTVAAALALLQEEPLTSSDFVRFLLQFADFAARERLFSPAQLPRVFLAVPSGVDPSLHELTQDWPAALDKPEGFPRAEADGADALHTVPPVTPGLPASPVSPGLPISPVIPGLPVSPVSPGLPVSPVSLTPAERERLKRLDIEWLLPADLDPMLAVEPDIKSLFFAVEMVAPEQSLRRILGEFRVEELEADEAAAILAKLTSTGDSGMNSVGLIRFFGYPREFLRQLVKDPVLREIMIKGAEFKAELDYAVLDFLHRKCLLIGKVLLATAPVDAHAPARQAVVPYVFSRMVIKYLKNTNSKVLQEIARSGARRDFYEDANLDLIRADLLTLAVDLAELELTELPAASPQERARLEALRQAARDTPDAAKLAQRFSEDWEALQPSVRTMEKKLLAFLPRDPVLLLDDFGSLKDEKGKASRLLEGFRKRFQKPDPGN